MLIAFYGIFKSAPFLFAMQTYFQKHLRTQPKDKLDST